MNAVVKEEMTKHHEPFLSHTHSSPHHHVSSEEDQDYLRGMSTKVNDIKK